MADGTRLFTGAALVVFVLHSLRNVSFGSLGATFGLVIIFWSVITTVCKEAGLRPYDKWPTLMIFGVVMAALFTSSMWLFRGNPLFLSAAYKQASGISLNMLSYSAFNFTLATASIIVYILLCKYLFRADVSALKNIDLAFLLNGNLQS